MTFEFETGNSHVTMDLGSLVLLVLLAAVYLWFTYWLLSRGIRSLRGKPLNNPPSRLFWEKVTADVLDTEDEEIWHGIPEAFQATHKAKKGTAIVNHDGYMMRMQSCKVSYTYRDESYVSTVRNPVIRDGQTEIYCYKRNPASTKVYIPDRSWSKGAGISMLFFAGFLILVAFIVLCGTFS